MTNLRQIAAMAALCLLPLLSAAVAADLPSAQPAATAAAAFTPAVKYNCTLANCSGFYARAGLTGIGGNVAVPGAGNVFAGATIFDIGGGYQFWNGTYFFAAEVSAGVQATSNGAAGSAIGAGSFVGLEQVKFGGALAGLLGAAQPGVAMPSQAPAAFNVPSTLSSAMIAPYVAVGALQRGGSSAPVTGVGAEFLLASNWNLDLEALYATPAGGESAYEAVRLGVQYHFAP